jgi:hypothetical protein
VNVILDILETNISWNRYTKLSSCDTTAAFRRFRKWCEEGAWQKAFYQFRTDYIERNKRVRPSWCKISLVCDSKGIPISFSFFPANVSDIASLKPIIDFSNRDVIEDKRRSAKIVAGRGYNSSKLREAMKQDMKMKLVTERIRI